MGEGKVTRVTIGHIGALPRTALAAALLAKAKDYVLLDIEGGEMACVDTKEGTVTILPKPRGKTVVLEYDFNAGIKKEKRVAPYGKKAKRAKGYPK